MEDPGGAEDFKHGGWAFEFDRGDEGDKFKLDEAQNSEALLLGRVTYEGFADAWPQREGEFAGDRLACCRPSQVPGREVMRARDGAMRAKWLAWRFATGMESA